MFTREIRGATQTLEINYYWSDSMIWIHQEWKNTPSKMDAKETLFIESKEATIYLRDELNKILEDWERIDKEYDEDMIRLEKED